MVHNCLLHKGVNFYFVAYVRWYLLWSLTFLWFRFCFQTEKVKRQFLTQFFKLVGVWWTFSRECHIRLTFQFCGLYPFIVLYHAWWATTSAWNTDERVRCLSWLLWLRFFLWTRIFGVLLRFPRRVKIYSQWTVSHWTNYLRMGRVWKEAAMLLFCLCVFTSQNVTDNSINTAPILQTFAKFTRSWRKFFCHLLTCIGRLMWRLNSLHMAFTFLPSQSRLA